MDETGEHILCYLFINKKKIFVSSHGRAWILGITQQWVQAKQEIPTQTKSN